MTDAARRVDVQADVLVRVLRLEEQQLRDDQVRHVVVDRPDEEDHALLQQARVDVVRALAAAVCSTTIGTRFIWLTACRSMESWHSRCASGGSDIARPVTGTSQWRSHVKSLRAEIHQLLERRRFLVTRARSAASRPPDPRARDVFHLAHASAGWCGTAAAPARIRDSCCASSSKRASTAPDRPADLRVLTTSPTSSAERHAAARRHPERSGGGICDASCAPMRRAASICSSRTCVSTMRLRQLERVRREQPSITCFFSRARTHRRARGACSLRTSARSCSMPPSFTPYALQNSSSSSRQLPLLDRLHRRRRTRPFLPASVGDAIVRPGTSARSCVCSPARAPAMPGFEIGEHAAGAEDDRNVLALAAFERLAVDRAVEIHRDAIGVLRLSRSTARTSDAARAGSGSSRRRRASATSAAGRLTGERVDGP